MTENPCFKPDVPNCDYHGGFPTPSAKLLEVREAPDQSWSLAASDLTLCYNYTCGNPNKQPVEFEIPPLMYPGLLDFLGRIDPAYARSWKARFFPMPDNCIIQRAIRTVLFVRGSHPYGLVVDDFQKSDKPANYRWALSDKMKMKDEGRAVDNKDETFCVVLAPGSSSTEGTVYHRRDEGDQKGLPRLLLRDVSENDNRKQPVIRNDQTVFKLPEEKYNREDTNAFFIERQNVIDPAYKVLLYPYRTGEKLPVTTWNEAKTALKVDLQNGTVDTITFNKTNPDHRTRVSFQRSSGAKP
jgi:hypothetical protein